MISIDLSRVHLSLIWGCRGFGKGTWCRGVFGTFIISRPNLQYSYWMELDGEGEGVKEIFALVTMV